MMFYVHTATAWLAPEHKTGQYMRWVEWLGGLVAPTFLALAGLSSVLAARRLAPTDALKARARTSLRGLKIAAVGVGLAVVFFLLRGGSGTIDKLWRADILPCIGLSMATLPWLAWPFPGPRRKWLAAILFVALPIVALGLQWLRIDEVLPSVLAVQLSVSAGNGSFPVVPYGAWMALGFFLGAVFPSTGADATAERRFFLCLAVVAVALYVVHMGLAWAFHRYDVFAPWGVRPGRGMLHSFFHKASFVLCLVVLARLSVVIVPPRSKEVLTFLGQTSLFAYCAHLLLLYHLGGQLLSGRLAPAAVFACTLGLGAAVLGLCAIWQRLEWPSAWRVRA